MNNTDPTNVTLRGTILDQAKALTEGDRNQAYGDPKKGMDCFAKLIAAYLNGKFDAEFHRFNGTDAAMIMCLLKISRIASSPNHMDSYIDLAAYAAIGGECAIPTTEQNEGGKNG